MPVKTRPLGAALMNYREKKDLKQFHAAKAFSGYIDHVVKGAQTKAEQRFLDNSK